MEMRKGKIQEVREQELSFVALLRLRTKHCRFLFGKTVAVTVYSPKDACIAYSAYLPCLE